MCQCEIDTGTFNIMNLEDASEDSLDVSRRANDRKLENAFQAIYDKYSCDFTGIGDEIDLLTGEIVVNNGHVLGMRDERDIGIPVENVSEDADDEGDEFRVFRSFWNCLVSPQAYKSDGSDYTSSENLYDPLTTSNDDAESQSAPFHVDSSSNVPKNCPLTPPHVSTELSYDVYSNEDALEDVNDSGSEVIHDDQILLFSDSLSDERILEPDFLDQLSLSDCDSDTWIYDKGKHLPSRLNGSDQAHNRLLKRAKSCDMDCANRTPYRRNSLPITSRACSVTANLLTPQIRGKSRFKKSSDSELKRQSMAEFREHLASQIWEFLRRAKVEGGVNDHSRCLLDIVKRFQKSQEANANRRVRKRSIWAPPIVYASKSEDANEELGNEESYTTDESNVLVQRKACKDNVRISASSDGNKDKATSLNGLSSYASLNSILYSTKCNKDSAKHLRQSDVSKCSNSNEMLDQRGWEETQYERDEKSLNSSGGLVKREESVESLNELIGDKQVRQKSGSPCLDRSEYRVNGKPEEQFEPNRIEYEADQSARENKRNSWRSVVKLSHRVICEKEDKKALNKNEKRKDVPNVDLCIANESRIKQDCDIDNAQSFMMNDGIENGANEVYKPNGHDQNRPNCQTRGKRRRQPSGKWSEWAQCKRRFALERDVEATFNQRDSKSLKDGLKILDRDNQVKDKFGVRSSSVEVEVGSPPRGIVMEKLRADGGLLFYHGGRNRRDNGTGESWQGEDELVNLA